MQQQKKNKEIYQKILCNDHIEYNGKLQPIVFPEPKAITVRYELESLMPGLFDLIEKYLDPDNPECISFARYRTDDFLKNKNENYSQYINDRNRSTFERITKKI